MATCKDCIHFNNCLSYGKTRYYYGEISACNDVQERCKYFRDKQNFAEICRCKDCLYFEYKIGSYGICEYWHTNNQDTFIFDLNFCGYAEPRTPKERGADKTKITCLNCKHLIFSDMYGECNKQLKIVNPSDTCEYAEPKERGREK